MEVRCRCGLFCFYLTVFNFVFAPNDFVLAVVSTLAGGTVGSWSDGAGTNATFKYPIKVAFDASGNVLVADNHNHRVRRVTPSGGSRLIYLPRLHFRRHFFVLLRLF